MKIDYHAADRRLAELLDCWVWDPMCSRQVLDNEGWTWKTEAALELASKFNLNIDLSDNEGGVEINSENGETIAMYEDHPDKLQAIRYAIVAAVIDVLDCK